MLQVLSSVKTATQTTTSDSFSDVTDLSIAITPSSTGSKILVLVSLNSFGPSGAAQIQTILLRGATKIFAGDTAGSRTPVFGYLLTSDAASMYYIGATFLDAPSTTSSTTYKVQFRSTTSGQAVGINRGKDDADNAAYGRSASSITVMEIGA